MVAIVRLIERFSGLFGLIGAWVMLPLIVSMVYEVLARHFFNAPTFWAYEVGYMLAGTTYMFGMGYCLRQGAHIRVDFLYEQMSLKRKALVNFLGYLILMLPGSSFYVFIKHDAKMAPKSVSAQSIPWSHRKIMNAIGFLMV